MKIIQNVYWRRGSSGMCSNHISSSRTEWSIFEPNYSGNIALAILSIVLSSVSLAVILDRYFLGGVSPLFWDLEIYVAAAELLSKGDSPYNSQLLHAMGIDPGLSFIYPPATLLLFKEIATYVSPRSIEISLIVIHYISIFMMPLLLCRILFDLELYRYLLSISIFLLTFGAGVIAFAAGNFGTTLSCLMVASLLPGFEKNRWSAFHVCLIIAASFKPHYISFWMLPIFAHGFSLRQFVISIICGVFTTLMYIVSALAVPDLFADWIKSVVAQTTNLEDFGWNIFGFLYKSCSSQYKWITYPVHLLQVGLILLVAFNIKNDRRVAWAILIVSATMINPRMMPYDLAVAAIPLVFIISSMFSSLMPLNWSVAITSAAVVVFSFILFEFVQRSLISDINLIAAPVLIMATLLLVFLHSYRRQYSTKINPSGTPAPSRGSARDRRPSGRGP